jgi:prepilin-type processing-associated H-X9-DG protein
MIHWHLTAELLPIVTPRLQSGRRSNMFFVDGSVCKKNPRLEESLNRDKIPFSAGCGLSSLRALTSLRRYQRSHSVLILLIQFMFRMEPRPMLWLNRRSCDGDGCGCGWYFLSSKEGSIDLLLRFKPCLSSFPAVLITARIFSYIPFHAAHNYWFIIAAGKHCGAADGLQSSIPEPHT